MDFKQSLKDQANIRYDQNYHKVERFFDHNLTYMSSLTFIKFEILNCLILDYNNASITLTNHFVERMLKLSLIQLGMKNIMISDIEYSTKVNQLHQQNDRLKLHKSLEYNKKKNLITQSEYNYLSVVAKEFRDSYSHAEIGKINKNKTENFSGHLFSISDVKSKLIKGETNFNSNIVEIPSVSPSIAQLNQSLTSRENALEYFSTVYDILLNIENRIKEN